MNNYTVKVTLIGDGRVGKTSLRRSFMGDSFVSNYIETIGSDFSHKRVVIGENIAHLNLWDIAGQPMYRNIQPAYFKKSMGCIAVYSRDDPESAKALDKWLDEYFKHSGYHNTPILVIGNKSDLVDSVPFISEQEHHQIVLDLKEKYPDSDFIDALTSAKTGENVETSIIDFVNLCIDWIQNKQGITPFKLEVDYNKNFPMAVLMTMNDMSGPLLITTSPPLENFDKNKTISGVISLVASIDFEELTKFRNLVGQTPWIQPDGNLYYISFTMSNPKARGGTEMYILGVVAKRELQIIVDEVKSTVNGHLHSSSNFVSRYITVHKPEFTTKLYSHGFPNIDLSVIEEHLDELRKLMQKAIAN